MQTKNTFAIKFIMRKSKVRSGKCPLNVRIMVNGQRVEMYLKETILEHEWDNEKQMPKQDTKELRKLYEYLEEVRFKLKGHYRELSLSKQGVTAESVRDAYTGKMFEEEIKKPVEAEPDKTIRWLVRHHNNMMKVVLKYGNMKNYLTTERYLHAYLEANYPGGDLALNKLNYAFMTGFEIHIRTYPIKYSDPCHTNGTMKHLERLKKISQWGYNNEWISRNPFGAYKLKLQPTNIGYLEQIELDTIENRHFSDPLRQRVKNIFIFCCYTGLAYVDVMALKSENIVTGADGTLWIKAVRQKTGIAFHVPLLDRAADILEIFNSEKQEPFRNTLSPYVTNQEMNRSLKIIAEVCEIYKDLTFHLARHTFATTVTLANDVPIESISKMLGHTKITTTMGYAKVVNTKVAKDMATLQEKLTKKVFKMRAV